MATASKKKTARKKTTKKTARKKTTKKSARPKAASTTAAKKRATASKAAASRLETLSSGARKLMLANLGLYGTVLDELQAQAARASKVINDARSNPASVNKDLVKRGEALEKQITDLLKRSGAPASRQLKKQMDELSAAIGRLRQSIKR